MTLSITTFRKRHPTRRYLVKQRKMQHSAKLRHLCRYTQCCYTQCRYTQCRYTEYLNAECQYAECRFAECRGIVKQVG